MKIAVLHSGHSIYGVGDDLSQAIEDAREWLDGETDLTDLPLHQIGQHGTIDGVMCYAKITDELAAAVKQHGGDIAYNTQSDGSLSL